MKRQTSFVTRFGLSFMAAGLLAACDASTADVLAPPMEIREEGGSTSDRPTIAKMVITNGVLPGVTPMSCDPIVFQAEIRQGSIGPIITSAGRFRGNFVNGVRQPAPPGMENDQLTVNVDAMPQINASGIDVRHPISIELIVQAELILNFEDPCTSTLGRRFVFEGNLKDRSNGEWGTDFSLFKEVRN